MKKTVRKTYTLEPDDIRRALADYINLHSCGEDQVDEERMTVSFDYGALDEQRRLPTITVTDGDY